VRRSFDRKHGRSPLHLVSAYATERGLVLAQRATEAKGGELAVLPDLLDGLDLRGCLISLDALVCQPAIACQIVSRGGEYLITLKGNRRKAYAEARDWFAASAFALGAFDPIRTALLVRTSATKRSTGSTRSASRIRRRLCPRLLRGQDPVVAFWPACRSALISVVVAGFPAMPHSPLFTSSMTTQVT
jgi:hypothetical protein